MLVRPRADSDLSQLGALAETVWRTDGYPTYRPADLLYDFLVSVDAIGAWVAEEDGQVVGHVSLHDRTWKVVMELARKSTGRTDEQLAVVARLLVSPQYRSHGLGRALLGAASAKAHSLGRLAILDVVATHTAAIKLYEATGWRWVGTVDFPLPDGRTVPEHVYVLLDGAAD